jgi:flagellar basal body P-ring protein FlgI
VTRTYTSIIIWSDTYPQKIKSERFYVALSNGSLRDLKLHRTVRAATIERHVSRALRNGQYVTFETCKPDFTVSQSVTIQLPNHP